MVIKVSYLHCGVKLSRLFTDLSEAKEFFDWLQLNGYAPSVSKG